MSSSTTIPKNSLVLVTGVNGYLGMHVGDQLLLAGYKVRGTVRDSEKAEWTKEYFDGKYGVGTFEVAVVEDLGKEGVFNDLVKGCSGICHVASDVSFASDPNKVVTPVVNNITSLLHAATSEPTIKSFVLTSSSAAISDTLLGEKYSLDSSVWNHKAVEKAWAPPPYSPERGGAVYSASKMQGEQKAWEIVKQNGDAGFKFNSINPNLLIGSLLHSKQNKSSGGMMLGLKNGVPRAISALTNLGDQWTVDVVDVAKLHVIALTDPDVSAERILAYTDKISINSLVDRIAHVAGVDKLNGVEKVKDGEKNLGEVDIERGKNLLKGVGLPGFKPLDESLRDLFQSAEAISRERL